MTCANDESLQLARDFFRFAKSGYFEGDDQWFHAMFLASLAVLCLLSAQVVCLSRGYVTIGVCGTCQTTQPEPDTPSGGEGQPSDVEETHHVAVVLQAKDVNVDVRKTIRVEAAEVPGLTRTMIRVKNI